MRKVVKNLKVSILNGQAHLTWDPNDDQWGVCCFQQEKDLVQEAAKNGVEIQQESTFCKLKEVNARIDYNERKCHLDDAPEEVEKEVVREAN